MGDAAIVALCRPPAALGLSSALISMQSTVYETSSGSGPDCVKTENPIIIICFGIHEHSDSQQDPVRLLLAGFFVFRYRPLLAGSGCTIIGSDGLLYVFSKGLPG